MAKYGMSMCVLGMAAEFKSEGIAVNALWPRTAIWTAAIENISLGDSSMCRKDSIMSDAAYIILTKSSREFTGNFCVDDEILYSEGVRDFDKYSISPGSPLNTDFFLDESAEDFLQRKAREKVQVKSNL
ncbi:hydroxysteroid dehydrogenase-like protein 2 [Plakobranchus ocellatus]|uniref:Hydroxysteroid dehydrogenase-like protein 2 n=1 Tax=Plakobranchus ocellatus TaxID=259542 RepID=A0AAV4A4G9_9GAST|nr:hydroxysteroid dehydrogenase-like protein 2 [Plakobranchus ocellatus]